MRRISVLLLLVVVVAAAHAAPALAQMNLSGNWGARYQEDQPERIPGPFLGDYLGLPITEGARQWALSWNASRLTLPEHQCQVHTVAYIYRGPLQLRIWEEKHPVTQEVIAIKNYTSTYEQTRTIWMDGRPHPSDHAAHTWMGFSTGKWDGDTLTVTTTHVKQGWTRRNGVPSSDKIKLTEHFIRHGDMLTHVSIVDDPVFLTEPLVKSENFVLLQREPTEASWLWPCEYVVEISERQQGEVPSYLFGENRQINEFFSIYGIPLEAAMGGAQTMYPEFRLKLEELMKARNTAEK